MEFQEKQPTCLPRATFADHFQYVRLMSGTSGNKPGVEAEASPVSWLFDVGERAVILWDNAYFQVKIVSRRAIGVKKEYKVHVVGYNKRFDMWMVEDFVLNADLFEDEVLENPGPKGKRPKMT